LSVHCQYHENGIYFKAINSYRREDRMAAKFSVYKDKAGKYRFNLKAPNGEIVAVSESYPDKKTALKGIASVQKNAAVSKISDATGEVEMPKTRGRRPAEAKAENPETVKAAPKPRGKPATVITQEKAATAPKPRGCKPKSE
jgi:uncharacterized protein YegP (UPF0339 family)